MKLKDLQSKVKVSSVLFKAKCVSVGLGAAIAGSTLNVFAAEDAKTLVNLLTDQIFNIFRYIGILLLAWSIGSLVLAFKDEDANSKSKAMMMAVCSILLISVKTIFSALGLSA